ncbi:MAG: glucose-6-phosphate isomerase [Gammaproteobacteria bacterium]|nr:glucose-6-phosphate isomerase [Gammaproteobacteria bacterium]
MALSRIPEISPLSQSAAWLGLQQHAKEIASLQLAELLDRPERYDQCARTVGDVVLDFSRNLVTSETLGLLIRLAEERDLSGWREALFSGLAVNNTEERPALHMALRAGEDEEFSAGDVDVMSPVLTERRKMLRLAGDIRFGTFRGYRNDKFTDIVNIGIGGSDLGLVMATEALQPYAADGPRVHFVSSVDGTQLADVLDRVRPETTLFVICSKSFTTLETRVNAEAARRWVLEHAPETALQRHFIAISVNDPAMDDFGIAPDHRLRIWDWVGGRYSLWSAIGLSIAIAIGPAAFNDMLRGAAALDRHFRESAFIDNLPVLLAMLGVWNQNFLGITNHVVLPYDGRLHRFPAFLQQLDMESLGKHVDRNGDRVNLQTGAVVWGEPGSNSQHSFFQLLHQGTSRSSMDFLAPVEASSRFHAQHVHGLANMLAQAEAFARGVSAETAREALLESGATLEGADSLAPHKEHIGGRASNILLFRRLDPYTLGFLVALYEHKVFVQSVIWGINPFDQWGVELGKTMAARVHAAMTGAADADGLPPIARQISSWQAKD